MPQRKITFNSGECYHVYNKSINNEIIFKTHDNYIYLIEKIQKYCKSLNIEIIAYCLMPNHFHFLLQQKENTPISKYIFNLFNCYSKAFNKMYNRNGTLFQGRFKCILVDDNSYMVHLIRYIHRNPIDRKKPLVTQLENYQYSDY